MTCKSGVFRALISSIAIIALASSVNAAARVQFANEVLDFGVMGQGKKVDLSYSFKNIGDSDLLIGEIRTSCGCTNATVSSKTIAPGKTGVIKAEFNSGGFRGKIEKYITVETNDPNRKTVQLKVTGKVKPAVEISPSDINFGTLGKGQRKNEVVYITPADPKSFVIKRVECRAKYVTLGAVRKSTKIKNTWELPVVITSDTNPGRVFDIITITTNAPGNPVQVVRVLGEVSGS